MLVGFPSLEKGGVEMSLFTNSALNYILTVTLK